MSEDMTRQFKLTAAHVANYCFENQSRLGFGLPEVEIVHHNSAHSDMGAETTGKAIDELVRVGLLKVMVYEGNRTVLRGDQWSQRITILEEQGWR